MLTTDRWLRAIGPGLLLFSALFAVYVSTMEVEDISNDAHSANVGSWRIAVAGEPWLDGVDLRPVGVPDRPLWIDRASNGHTVVFRSPGVIAAGVPAYWLYRTTFATEEFQLWPGSATAALLTAIGCLFFYLSLTGLVRRGFAVAAAGAMALATPMWTVSGNVLWTHSLTAMSIFGMAWSARNNRWWLVGVFGGVGLWGRLHVSVIVAVLGLALSWTRREPRIAITIGGVSAVFLGLASVWSHWMYGSWSPTGGYSGYVANLAGRHSETFSDHVLNHLGMWVSPDRGLLVWTPVLILMFPAVVRAWRQLPDWSQALVIGGLVYTAIQGQLNLFTGGDGYYGYRLQLELLACLAPAYALSCPRMGRWARAALGPLLGLQFAAMSIGATSEGFYVLMGDAWTDNSLALALRTFPALALWLALMVVVGALATRVVLERASRSAMAAGKE